jgi:hypothetical protein
VPYSNGQWVNTEQGWYFQAPTPYEEVVHHYGRWTNSPTEGWVWVPGRVWSPAWVDWKENDEYVAWTPLPPGSYIIDDKVNDYQIYDDKYVVVEKRYFVEPELYKYHVVENKKKTIIQELRKVNGVMVVNHRVINKGPEVSIIESVLGVPIPVVKIDKVTTYRSIGYSDNVIHTYSPEFKKFKVVNNIKSPVRKPVKYVSYEKVKKNKKSNNSNSENSDYKKGKDNNNGKDRGKIRLSDDTKMDPRNHKNEQESKGKENKEKKKDNGNGHKENENKGNDHKDNGNKNNKGKKN